MRAPTIANQHVFPTYTGAELAADRAVHAIGLPAGLAAAIWLVAAAWPGADPAPRVACLVYVAGLVGMLAASAAYNLARPGRLKIVLRRLDHAMIFVMIAGTYTPVTLVALRPGLGIPLCAFTWTLAILGVALKVGWYHRVERVSLALYLGMSWGLVAFVVPIVRATPGDVLALLAAGGLVYSAGSFLHEHGKALKYHNAVWHAMVLAAAALHFAAVARLLLA